jgi:hypothetical protein
LRANPSWTITSARSRGSRGRQQPAQDRGRDRERQVPDHAKRLARERRRQDVRLDDGDPTILEAPPEDAGELRVELDRDHARSRRAQRGRQPPGAGADVHDQLAGPDTGRRHDLAGNPRAAEEVAAVSGPGMPAARARGHGRSP